MTKEINSLDDPLGAREPGGRMSRGAAWEDLPEAHVERTDAYRALLDQGLRLNQIFASIRDPLVREAIINFVAESAKSKSG
jgi:hypothetical protein